MAKKENVLAIMLGGKKSKKGKKSEEDYEEEEHEEGSDYDEAFSEAASEAYEAVQNEDEEGFASALKDAIHLCIDDMEE
tara:strand:- start:30 stop:266 length:237 start_codon:yes stop_codon:yes gene_type:complete